jgi:uncharacterized damage-inducible protein DinB
MLQSELLFLVEYMNWARQKLLEAVAILSPEERNQDLGGGFGSIQKTLEHIVWAEETWRNRFYGLVQPGTDAAQLEHLADLKEHWEQIGQQIHQWIAALPEGPVDRVLEYADSRGNQHTTPISVLMQHLSHHQTYHRGQIALMLRQLGRPAVSTDLILYYREQKAAQ